MHFVYLVVVIAIPFLGRVLVYNKFGALLPSWFLSVPILIFFFNFRSCFKYPYIYFFVTVAMLQ